MNITLDDFLSLIDEDTNLIIFDTKYNNPETDIEKSVYVLGDTIPDIDDDVLEDIRQNRVVAVSPIMFNMVDEIYPLIGIEIQINDDMYEGEE